MLCFPDDARFRMTYAPYKPGKSDAVYVDAHIWQRSGLREDIAEHPASSRRRAAASAEYNSGRHAFSWGGIVISPNWKRSLPVSELGSKDKLNTSGHPIKHPGKFPFWYPFGHVPFIKEHSGWNEIKGFLFCFFYLPVLRHNLVSCIMKIRRRLLIKKAFSVSDYFNYFSNPAWPKSISECLKASEVQQV